MLRLLFYAIYNLFGLPLYWLGFAIFSIFNKKARKGFLGRSGTFKTLKEAKNEFENKNVLLIHSSSSGEWEQAAPIVKLIKEDQPDIYIIATFFSYSGMKNVKDSNIDLKIYLPFDSIYNARRLFDIIKPKLWLISKYDIWPNFVYAAHRQNIPSILASAELAEDSVRHKGINRIINSTFYPLLTHILPKSEGDKGRFQQISPSYKNFLVTGDARFDQIYQKAQNALKDEKVKIFNYSPEKIMIGGSMWPADEKHVLPAMASCLKKHPELSLIIAPHELHEDHISAIEDFFSNAGLESERYSNFNKNGGTNKRIAIVNTIGMLAKIYRQTDLAYVGGSFSSGVHNTMEPAAYGQPVVFGPKYKNAYEACELVKIGAGFSINNKEEANSIFEKLISNNQYRSDCSKKAKSFLEESLGASEQTYSLMMQYL